jgi:hypothetical protein
MQKPAQKSAGAVDAPAERGAEGQAFQDGMDEFAPSRRAAKSYRVEVDDMMVRFIPKKAERERAQEKVKALAKEEAVDLEAPAENKHFLVKSYQIVQDFSSKIGVADVEELEFSASFPIGIPTVQAKVDIEAERSVRAGLGASDSDELTDVDTEYAVSVRGGVEWSAWVLKLGARLHFRIKCTVPGQRDPIAAIKEVAKDHTQRRANEKLEHLQARGERIGDELKHLEATARGQLFSSLEAIAGDRTLSAPTSGADKKKAADALTGANAWQRVWKKQGGEYRKIQKNIASIHKKLGVALADFNFEGDVSELLTCWDAETFSKDIVAILQDTNADGSMNVEMMHAMLEGMAGNTKKLEEVFRKLTPTGSTEGSRYAYSVAGLLEFYAALAGAGLPKAEISVGAGVRRTYDPAEAGEGTRADVEVIKLMRGKLTVLGGDGELEVETSKKDKAIGLKIDLPVTLPEGFDPTLMAPILVRIAELFRDDSRYDSGRDQKEEFKSLKSLCVDVAQIMVTQNAVSGGENSLFLGVSVDLAQTARKKHKVTGVEVRGGATRNVGSLKKRSLLSVKA